MQLQWPSVPVRARLGKRLGEGLHAIILQALGLFTSELG